MERAKGFEPSTSTLARLRSTPELRPLISDLLILPYMGWMALYIFGISYQYFKNFLSRSAIVKN